MKNRIYFSILTVLFIFATSPADTFKNNQTGDTFHGFATQKTLGTKIRVYNSDKETFETINITEYTITRDNLGRRDNVIIVPISKEEVILSQVVIDTVNETIIDASNKGPQFVVIEIDSPGGRGDYMRQICETILKTQNCTTVAYITGEETGGAYSAATAIALACDKIYIAPNAVMGAVKVRAGGLSDEEMNNYKNTFSSDRLSAYSNYVSVLAEKHNRPEILATGFLDRTIEIAEVTDKNNKKYYVNMANRKPDETVVRRLTKAQSYFGDADKKGGDYTEFILELTATEAVETKMADKIVSSRLELLEDMGAGGMKFIVSGQIDKAVRKFAVNRRNIQDVLLSINFLEERSQELQDLLKERSSQMSKNEVRREYYEDMRGPTGLYDSARYRRSRRVGNRRESEVVIESEPLIDYSDILDDLSFVLEDLMRDYRRAIALAKRYPGALPENLNSRVLDQRLRAAEILYDDVLIRLDNYYNSLDEGVY